jgi:hypothetical protein
MDGGRRPAIACAEVGETTPPLLVLPSCGESPASAHACAATLR